MFPTAAKKVRIFVRLNFRLDQVPRGQISPRQISPRQLKQWN